MTDVVVVTQETVVTVVGDVVHVVTPVEDVVHVITAIEQGPEGPGVATYTQTFASAQAPWTVNHNLGREPNVQVLSAGGMEVVALVVHASSNQAVVYFASPQTGRVRCI